MSSHMQAAAVLTVTANILINDGILNFNGNDAVTLEKNGAVIDRIGEVGNNPGASWPLGGGSVTTANSTLQRKSGITRGDSSTGTFNPALQWNALPANTYSGLGSHSP
jgi:uncharacterized protein